MELACHTACCSSSPVAPHPAPRHWSQSCRRHAYPITCRTTSSPSSFVAIIYMSRLSHHLSHHIQPLVVRRNHVDVTPVPPLDQHDAVVIRPLDRLAWLQFRRCQLVGNSHQCALVVPVLPECPLSFHFSAMVHPDTTWNTQHNNLRTFNYILEGSHTCLWWSNDIDESN